MKIVIIVAVAQNRVIGRASGEMPWHVSEDFKHFKQTTLGHPVLMGRKSFESLGKPLKGRENIVITRNKNYNPGFDEVKIFHSLEDAVSYCKLKGEDKIFITGGGEIYRQSISLADEMIISYMKFDAEGEITFPDFSNDDWKIVSRDDREQFEIVTYKRKH